MLKSTVLKVGDRLISSEEIIDLLERYQLLPQLVQEVIIDDAVAAFDCSEKELVTTRQKFYQQQQLNTQEQQESWQQKRGITSEVLAAKIAREVKLAKFKQLTWGQQLPEYFSQRQQQLAQVVYWLLRIKKTESNLIEQLYSKLESGENNFSELARQYSTGSEVNTGGLVGPVEVSTLHPQLTQILSQSEVGLLKKPFLLGDWWVIVRVEKWLPATLDEGMRQRLIEELFKKWLEKKAKQNLGWYQINITDDPLSAK